MPHSTNPMCVYQSKWSIYWHNDHLLMKNHWLFSIFKFRFFNSFTVNHTKYGTLLRFRHDDDVNGDSGDGDEGDIALVHTHTMTSHAKWISNNRLCNVSIFVYFYSSVCFVVSVFVLLVVDVAANHCRNFLHFKIFVAKAIFLFFFLGWLSSLKYGNPEQI